MIECESIGKTRTNREQNGKDQTNYRGDEGVAYVKLYGVSKTAKGYGRKGSHFPFVHDYVILNGKYCGFSEEYMRYAD